jgi:hypothetical protein
MLREGEAKRWRGKRMQCGETSGRVVDVEEEKEGRERNLLDWQQLQARTGIN